MAEIIGVASGWGASNQGTQDGPYRFKERLSQLLEPDVKFQELDIAPCEALPYIVSINERLAESTQRALQTRKFPLILGGDHSITIGTWNGVKRALKEKGKEHLGLIWIDAHLDCHTPETTPSGAFHGMGLAALLGHGNEEFIHLFFDEPIVEPHEVYVIGARSYEKEELELLEELGLNIVFQEEVKEKGIAKVLEEAITDLRKGCDFLGLSLDLDAIDPKEAPGVGTPVPGGLSFKKLKKALEPFIEDFSAVEIVEFNPSLDRADKTKKIIEELIGLWAKR